MDTGAPTRAQQDTTRPAHNSPQMYFFLGAYVCLRKVVDTLLIYIRLVAVVPTPLIRVLWVSTISWYTSKYHINSVNRGESEGVDVEVVFSLFRSTKAHAQHGLRSLRELWRTISRGETSKICV